MKPLHQFSSTEADSWIIEMRHSLAAHAERLRDAEHPDEVRAAMDTHLMLLREMASAHPDKRESIEALISRYERT